MAQESYPSISLIPAIPAGRLARAHPDLHSNHPIDRATVLPFSSEGALVTAPDAGESTILYLAFGSNLCAKTFLGVRGIRPLSQVNVTAPSLTLTFDLPGLPYKEPCFANTAPRVFKKPDAISAGGLPGGLPDPPIPIPKLPLALIGVVYEVTSSDYAKIVASEGGGASYNQIVVPCLPLPPSVTIPEKPAVPEPPRPFLARTLCMPRVPDVPDEDNGNDGVDDGNGNEDGDGDKRKKQWKFLLPHQRPAPYAQPSLRYLTLLRTGAIEHDLPQDYQDYLNNLQPYTITSLRQRIGRFLLTALWLPLLLVTFGLAKVLGDKSGRSPRWLVIAMTVLFNAMWTSYDIFFRAIFGEGERTESQDDGDGGHKEEEDIAPYQDEDLHPSKRRRRRSSVAKTLRRFSGTSKIVDEEKKALMSAESDSD